MLNSSTDTASIQVARDRKLVRKMLTGDESAYRAFVDEYFPKLYRYAIYRLKDERDVEEVVLQVLTNAARRIETFRGQSTLLTWLIQICRHEISKQLHRATHNDLMLPFLNDDVLRSVVESIESVQEDDPEEATRRTELITLIQFALDQLPERYATALEMKYIEGFKSKEIANHLGIGDSAVQSLLARARRAFSDLCGEALRTALKSDSPNSTSPSSTP